MSKKIQDQFNDALKQRNKRGHYAKITFIGVNKADIKEHKKITYTKVTVDFVAEVITCIRDMIKIISGDPEKIKNIWHMGFFRDRNQIIPIGS